MFQESAVDDSTYHAHAMRLSRTKQPAHRVVVACIRDAETDVCQPLHYERVNGYGR